MVTTETVVVPVTADVDLDIDEEDDGGAVVDAGDEEEATAEVTEEEAPAALQYGLKVVYTKEGEADGVDSVVQAE